MRAARFLGGAAQKVGASLARIAAGPSVEAVTTDLEGRASGPREVLDAAIVDWAQLLASTDDTPRYDSGGAGPALNFRTVFLQSRAFELAVANAGSPSAAAAAEPDGATSTADAAPEASDVPGGKAWAPFLQGACIPGGADVAAKLPELFSKSRRLPDCRRWVEEVTQVVKASAAQERMRVERSAAGSRAEEIRSRLRSSFRPPERSAGGLVQASGASGSGSPEERCRSSYEAVQLYAAFRDGLGNAVQHLRETLATQQTRLRTAHEALTQLQAEAASQASAAGARREEAVRQRDEALQAPRQAVERLQQDERRKETDARLQELEERRRQLQMELEEASKSLAAKREQRLALMRQREHVVSEHRRRREIMERELVELRPSQFHGVLDARAENMTEGEIVAALGKATKRMSELCSQAASASSSKLQQKEQELAGRRSALEGARRTALKEHARFELARLDAAGEKAEAAVAAILELARSRADRESMGLADSDNEDLLPSRRDLRRLRSALTAAEETWDEAAAFWGPIAERGAGSTEDEAPAMEQEEAQKAIAALEASKGRLVQCLGALQQADPSAYEMAFGDSGDDAGDLDAPALAAGASAPPLPHGWEAHVSPEGHVYYHNLVAGTTQWDLPAQDAAVSCGWRLVQAESGHWFYHNPHTGAGVWWPQLPDGPAGPPSIASLRRDAGAAASSSDR